MRKQWLRAPLVVAAMLLWSKGASAQVRPSAAGLPTVPPEPLVNHGRNVAWTPRHAFRPGTDIEELSRILRWVHTNLPPNVKVKAGGSRHSWSPVAATDGVYIHPEGMKFIRRIERAEVKPRVAVDYLFRIGAGATIREINRKLWREGAALPALGGFDGQTLGGVLTTGTHSSVLSHGPLAEMVKSIDLVKADGAKVRIEPRKGITDAKAFRGAHPDWHLFQADDVFDAALINMGTLGIVHSYVIAARERFWLNEIRTKTNSRRALEALRRENVYRLVESAKGAAAPAAGFDGHPVPAYYLELLWNPNSGNVIVTSRHPVGGAARERLTRREPSSFRVAPTRQLLRTLFVNPKRIRPLLPALAARVGRSLIWASKQLSKLTPKFATKFVDLALDGLLDRAFTQRSYNVFNNGDAVNQLPGQASTLSVPLRGDLYLRAMEIIRGTARQLARAGKYQTGPISLRFVKGSRAILGDPEDVCKFELIFSGDGRAARQLASEVTLAYYVALERELGAAVRFHWGQIIPDGAVPSIRRHLVRSFPRYQEFDRIRRSFDPQGRFLNAWQERLLPAYPASK